MTERRLFTALRHILTQISEEEYPEIFDIIDSNIDIEGELVYCSAEYIAELLHEADGAKQLPKCVADFLMEVYTDEMDAGNADAACNLGSLYYTGRCGEQNYAKAVKYYTIAAKGGCRQAQENLGYCYYYGRDTAIDYEKAFHFFALGAFDGHLRSLYKIGDMYRKGYYVEKNETEAFRIYDHCMQTMTEEALPLVGADVMMRMGDCYFSGIGTDVDYKTARTYYQRAEQLFFERLEEGDFMIRNCYNHVVARQNDIRRELEAALPSFEWVKKS